MDAAIGSAWCSVFSYTGRDSERLWLTWDDDAWKFILFEVYLRQEEVKMVLVRGFPSPLPLKKNCNTKRIP